jgi:hypothetical protein
VRHRDEQRCSHLDLAQRPGDEIHAAAHPRVAAIHKLVLIAFQVSRSLQM